MRHVLIAAMAALAIGCGVRDRITTVTVRDPSRVVIEDARGRPMFATVGRGEEVIETDPRITVTRDPGGDVALRCEGRNGPRVTWVTRGDVIVSSQPGVYVPQEESVRVDDRGLALVAPFYATCKPYMKMVSGAEVVVRTPLENVVGARREERWRREMLIYLPLGIGATVVGSALDVTALTHAGMTRGERAGVLTLGTGLFFLPGILMVAESALQLTRGDSSVVLNFGR